MNRRSVLGAFAVVAMGTSAMTAAMAQSFPERDVTAVIQWGAGGGTDVAMRGYAPYAEEVLGKKIVLQNKPGGAGAIGANFVMQQPSDGYTLLMGAEPQALFKVMDLAPFDYSEFYPVNVAAIANNIILVVNKDKPWQNMKDLVDDVQKNPGKIKQYLAGTGTVPFTVNAMINSVTKFPTTNVPFDGDGPAIAALQGGHVDIGFIASGAVIEHVKAGRLRAIATLGDKPYQGIPAITDAIPGVKKYLPWGSWYGVFVKKDTPEAAKAKLVDAFKKAGANAKYVELMEGRGTTMLNLSGAEAEAFIKKWQSTTAWLYQEAGVAKKNPADLGIPKP
ncbi:MAG: Bug family tripartite tricarboxylate transporter substrate binding protein [Beijerinckiaceae bacterium]